MSDIDFYIIQFAPEVQHRLMRIRSIALYAFPDHEEKNIMVFLHSQLAED